MQSDSGEVKSASDSASTSDKKKKHQNDNFAFYYGLLAHQQNMLQDSIRTSLYQEAFLHLSAKFEGKIVLDVGTGSGILAHFAVQAGAKKVYAVEASGMHKRAAQLMAANGLSDKIHVLHGKVEEIDLPEKVDIIVSEPMGVLLLHERMIESFLAARVKHLKPGGLMLPSVSTIYVCPFTDAELYHEQLRKASFWTCTNFFGLDMSSLEAAAVEEHLGQPVVGPVAASTLLAPESAASRLTLDFRTETPKDLQEVKVPFSNTITKDGTMHGLACWFDVGFLGEAAGETTKGVRGSVLRPPVVLSTAPSAPLTHWYQCRLLLAEPLVVIKGQVLAGALVMRANEKSSYNLTLTGSVSSPGTPPRAFSYRYQLQNVLFRCFWSGEQPQQPQQQAQQPQQQPQQAQQQTQSSSNGTSEVGAAGATAAVGEGGKAAASHTGQKRYRPY